MGRFLTPPPKKKTMELTIHINEQTVSKIIETVAKAFAQPTPSVPNAPQQSAPQPSQELEALQKQVASLQKELAQVKAQASVAAKPVPGASVAPKPVAAVAKPPVTETKPVVEPQATSQVESKQQETVKQEAPKPAPQTKPISEAPSQAKPNGNGNGSHAQPTAEKAEEWVRKNLGEWLDQSCRYAKAQKRTWRELATNVGDKIEVKGKPAVPRAYLHALEAWDTCNMWDRVKAKVALEFGKNGNGSH